jgi:creatinine amidohydrolase/Fe(II)-dependent formamide hydrolase-like protein
VIVVRDTVWLMAMFCFGTAILPRGSPSRPLGLSFARMRLRLAALLACLFASFAFAEAPRPVFLEEMTWTEVRDALKAGRTTILVPIGGTEQSGPYIALGKHNVRVKVLSGRIAEGLGTALVAPVIAYVPEGSIQPPTGHMRFPGTITIPESVFEQTLESAARGFRLHGFRDVVFLGDHGDYQKSIRKAVETLNREWAGTSTRAHAIDEYYRAATVDFARSLISAV